MKLVIDIDDGIAEGIIKLEGEKPREIVRSFQATIADAIKNGTPYEERPKGKWIEVDNGLVSGRCSLCGWEAVIMETDVCCMPFCPNCGADMRGDV